MKLRTRFSLIFAALATLVLVLTGLFLHFAGKRQLENKARAEQHEALRKFAGLCQEAAISKNDLILIPQLALLKADPRVAYAAYREPGGRVLVHSDPTLIGKPWDPAWEQGDVAVLRAPVQARGEGAGEAVLAFHPSVVAREIEAALSQDMRLFVVVASFALTIAILLGVLVAYSITRPIQTVAAGALVIGQGKLDHRIDIVRSDEIGFLAESFNQMAKKLQELDELKDQFISSVSHDLRNPMSAITMYADYALNDDADRDKLLPKHRDTLTTIMDNARRLGVFVNNILDAAKIKAGRMEYYPKAVDVSAVAQNVLSLFGIMARKQKIKLVAAPAAGLPPALADAERLEQVLANLVSNALKFTYEGGSITIGARAAGGMIEISVADTGKGIPAKDLPRLFGRFEQSEGAEQSARGIKGTGLGLFIVKQAVEGMGGKVTVSSVVDKGTTFAILLPQAAHA